MTRQRTQPLLTLDELEDEAFARSGHRKGKYLVILDPVQYHDIAHAVHSLTSGKPLRRDDLEYAGRVHISPEGDQVTLMSERLVLQVIPRPVGVQGILRL